MLKEILLKKLNTQSKTVNNAIITLGDTDDSGKGRHFKSRFIQPGLAGYPGQYGNALIRKENLDKFIHTMRNKPVIINHKNNITEKDKVGDVFNVWFNPDDGWYWCDGVITDKTAQNLIENKKWSVSCSYDFTKYDDEGGEENGIPYDIEFLDGEFSHLAIVNNPRYERANIVFNSKTEVKNGFITIDGGTENERVVWVPFEVLSEKARKHILEIADKYKEGDETKYDFSHTRVKPSEEQIKYIKDTVQEIQNIYKFKGIAQIEISSELNRSSLGVCASPDNCSIVALSPQLYNGKYNQERWDKSVESGFHPKGTGEMIKSVLVHELGHSITCNSKNSQFWSEIEGIHKEYMKEIKKGDIKNPDFISGYARTNKYEFVAEAFSQGVLAKKYGKYTKQVMESIDKHFKTEYQQKLFNAKQDKNEENEFWIEEYGLGYPIDEEALEQFNKEQDKDKKQQADNSKEQDMTILEMLKEFISKVENDKGDNMINNEKEDKRKLIDEVGGILKGKVDDEIIRTIIKKMEEASYNESEAGSADNKKVKNEAEDDKKKDEKKDDKKVANEDEKEEDKKKVDELKEDEKKDVENKCNNSKEDFFEKMNKIYNSSVAAPKEESYTSRAERLKMGEDYFKV